MHKWTTNREGKTLHLVLRLRGDDAQQHVRHQWLRHHQNYCVCVVKPSTTPMTTWHEDPEHLPQRTWTPTLECKHDPKCAESRSQVLVVKIAHYIMAQVSHVRVISWSSRDERISSTLSPLFSSTSSSSHSSLISCYSSCTSSPTLREEVTLRTSPEWRWTPLTTPASSQVVSPSPTTSRRLTSSPSQSPRPTHSSPSKGSLEDVDYYDTRLKEILHYAHRVHA